jgi:sulfur carrier protein ThiS
MKVTLKLYATLADCLPPGSQSNAVAIDVAADASIVDILDRFRVPERMTKLVLVNGSFVAPEDRASRHLQEGDQLAVWPPVAGG